MNITSIGAPPERHADRVIAGMLQAFAVSRANRWPAICAAFANSSDGTPRAQAKLQRRIREAGAMNVRLKPGKRGRYELYFYDWTGWAPGAGEIKPSDPVPPKPWIACWINQIGKHEGQTKLRSMPMLLITHHVLSRAAQRVNVRSPGDLMDACTLIWNASCKVLDRNDFDWERMPEPGWRQYYEGLGTVAFKVDETCARRLVAVTVF